jgi:hypothetical protein
MLCLLRHDWSRHDWSRRGCFAIPLLVPRLLAPPSLATIALQSYGPRRGFFANPSFARHRCLYFASNKPVHKPSFQHKGLAKQSNDDSLETLTRGKLTRMVDSHVSTQLHVLVLLKFFLAAFLLRFFVVVRLVERLAKDNH